MLRELLLIFSLVVSLQPLSAQSNLSSLPQEMKDSYVTVAEAYLNKEWKTLPVTLFARFKKDGNRVDYENACFERRRQLAVLAMGEIMEGKGRFIPDIVNGLQVMMEESWWGIPAHYNRAVPSYDNQTVDLFNAETASLMVWTAKELRPQLDKYAPDICRRINKEIEHRILRPAVSNKYWWKTAAMNWNPWICSNWLTCVLECETDSVRKEKAIGQIEAAMDSFISQYPDDGGCDEGTGYWDRAAASLYECMQQLHDAGIDDSKYRNNPKVRNMAAYIYRMYIGNDYCVNFADAHEIRSVVQLNVLYPFALYLNDETMRGYASYMAERKGFYTAPAALYVKSGNFPTLGRELRLLRYYNELTKEKSAEPLVEAWLPDLQIMTLRSKRMYLAAKGGNNGESHNHNDVGSFIVYADSTPLLIDPSVGEYTSQTFSKDRYSIWTMQSQYHNLPQINGVDQSDGKEYCAKLVKKEKRSVTFDLTSAYPQKAGLKSWVRKISMKSDAVEITDNFELTQCTEPVRQMFMTTTKPEVKNGQVILGRYVMSYDARQWSASVENISDKLDPLLKELWGNNMYRIVLTNIGRDLRGKGRVLIFSSHHSLL